MPLRNEDYVAFLDESGSDGIQVVGGVLIPARWLRAAERRWQDFIRDHLDSTSGRREVKSYELFKGTGVALQAQHELLAKGSPPISAQRAGWHFYQRTLELIASTAEVRVLAVGVQTKHAVDAYRLWFWLAYAALVERHRAPRPRLPLTIIDGQDAAFRGAHDLVAYRFYRSFSGRRHYIGSRKAWFVGGSAHHDSATLPFVQAADLVAGAARHAITHRQRTGSWFDTSLRLHARSMGREIDISRDALKQLKSLDPKDKCGSGHFGAILPP